MWLLRSLHRPVVCLSYPVTVRVYIALDGMLLLIVLFSPQQLL